MTYYYITTDYTPTSINTNQPPQKWNNGKNGYLEMISNSNERPAPYFCYERKCDVVRAFNYENERNARQMARGFWTIKSEIKSFEA